jgi:hypothetical protein
MFSREQQQPGWMVNFRADMEIAQEEEFTEEAKIADRAVAS